MKRIAAIIVFLFAFMHGTAVLATVRLPALVSDGMVLQRDSQLKIWGWADKNENIKITFKGKRYAVKAGADGKWVVLISPSSAGGPYAMEVAGQHNSITLHDILIGDVWLCSGQSNMVHSLELHTERYAQDIANANFPEIRQFLVPTHAILTGPAADLPEGKWKAANPENVLRFSVVGYFFAKNIYEKYHVPIGLINASVGGTPIEAWTSEEGLKDFADILRTVQQNKDTAYVNTTNRAAAIKSQQLINARPPDQGLAAAKKWYDPSYSSATWNTINIPGYWEDQGLRNLDGVVWYKREIEIPAAMTAKPAMVALGRIVDADYLYINGVLAGNKTYQYPQRRYAVPANLLKAGKNTFVIRVINESGKGGFVPDKPYYIAAGNDTIDLKGYWKYQVGAVYAPSGSTGGISFQNQPAALYNGMIAPYTNHAIKGVLWYQGEANAGKPEAYEALLPALIRDWRTQWAQHDLPFLYVQLPNFMEVDYSPSESQWARLRESQLKTLDVANTAMSVAIDLGEWNDIHPDNKKPIGDRLALAAQYVAYHEKNIIYSGPLFSTSTVSGNKITLRFNHAGGGLVSTGGEELKWFAVAGADKKFVWAHATIRDNNVVVWNDAVLSPVYVRYAWADNPDHINFYNQEGLPASPFQAQVAETR